MRSSSGIRIRTGFRERLEGFRIRVVLKMACERNFFGAQCFDPGGSNTKGKWDDVTDTQESLRAS